MTILNLQVIASADDCLRRLTPSYFNLGEQGNVAGCFSTTAYKYGCGMRFTNVTIPKGATIVTAYLTFRAANSYSATPVNTRISAEDVDNAVTFADDGGAFDTRFNAHTTARIDWDGLPAWTDGVEYQSPEIKTVIQEIIDRGSWASGNAIVLFWEDFDDRSTPHTDTNFRRGYSYNNSPTYAPKLHIEYATTQTVSPSAIASAEAFGTAKLNLKLFPSAIASLEAFGNPTVKFTTNIYPTGIASQEAFGSPTVLPGAVILQPSGIASLEAFGTPLVFYDQVIIPTGIASAEAFGTPTVSFILLIKPQGIPSAEAFGALKVLRDIIHIILDGQYTQGSPGVNRIYIIGKDAEGNPVYGTSLNQAEIDLVGERLDFNQDLSIPTTAKAADVAAAAVAKARLTGARGFIVIPPNCGQELWDVIQVTDKPTAQSQQKYRVIAVSFDYEPLRHRYQHKLILGAP